ncbi:hypothetical protein FHX49_001087 [Microbacterium endophyticum]|uniref:LamG-like jellyroll fold domain-containing protein n=1 Tax=Microbacterium endophyticum TaxID=1526412 RepID=A0A7W4YNB7_9MICO|nr:LamG-like jellyroll fold domain-containing protein [Microbacterium endophyticum]MBB2975521.1 hypothetical protein [Microbacterium endophyticum]NIK35460.1 hypothetical protein [Microbacterium endophyticum]
MPTESGYLVTLDLDERLPIKSDAPTLYADHQLLGIATESEDGLSLSFLSDDEALVKITSVTRGWSASGEISATSSHSASRMMSLFSTVADESSASVSAKTQVTVVSDDGEDPGAPGPYSVDEVEYDFGNAAIDLEGMTNSRGEMTGKLYLSSAEGERPVVLLLHGRHSWCHGSDWPCADGVANVRSYLGYEGTARALASHGYNVISIAANAINAWDNPRSSDLGAQARGALVLESLGMLRSLDGGDTVSYEDTLLDRTLDFDQAIEYASTRADQPAPASKITAADLRGRFDLTRVGLMGHSRGGEGVAAAAELNEELAQPFGLKGVLPLAPVDFGRRTIADIPTAVVLPYCDGDVSNQQGQKIIDGSRRAFDDDALRSAVWVMGADHNFFNSVWTPGKYDYGWPGDDWGASDSPTCGSNAPTRLSADEQYQVGVSYMSAFFRLTVGGESQFQSIFDGSVKPATPATKDFADVRIIATQPHSAETLVNDLAAPADSVSTTGGGDATVCASVSSRATPQQFDPCAPASSTSRFPHWSPASRAPNVEAYPVTTFSWAQAGDAMRVELPESARDVSSRTQLSFKMSPHESVADSIDLRVVVTDGGGHSASVLASEINPLATTRMPTSDWSSETWALKKIVLQEVVVPVSDLSGIDLSDVRSVTFESVADAQASSGRDAAYLSDVAFETPALGTATPGSRSTVNVATLATDEGDDTHQQSIAVYLDEPSSEPVTAALSLLNTSGLKAGPEALRVTIPAGETCLAVSVPLRGDTAADGGTQWIMTNVTATTGAVAGSKSFGWLSIRDDEKAVSPAPQTNPYGIAGDACAEHALVVAPPTLELSSSDVQPGVAVAATGRGYRPGELVTFSYAGAVTASAVADSDGAASAEITVPENATLGAATVSARGWGSTIVEKADVQVAYETTVDLDVASSELDTEDALTASARVTVADPIDTVDLDGGLIAEYALDQTSGSTVPNTAPDTKFGAAQVQGAASWLDGEGLSLDGSDDWVQLPDNLITGLDALSVSIQVKLTPGVGGNSWLWGFGNSVNGAGDGYVFVQDKPNLLAGATIGPWWTLQSVQGPGPLERGEWKTVTYTQGGGIAEIYVDGELVSQSAEVTPEPGQVGGGRTTNNAIGKSVWGSDVLLQGAVRDFRVYDRVLAPAEIGRLAGEQAASAPEATGTLALFDGDTKLAEVASETAARSSLPTDGAASAMTVQTAMFTTTRAAEAAPAATARVPMRARTAVGTGWVSFDPVVGLADGKHELRAVYTGDGATFAAQSAMTSVTVVDAAVIVPGVEPTPPSTSPGDGDSGGGSPDAAGAPQAATGALAVTGGFIGVGVVGVAFALTALGLWLTVVRRRRAESELLDD